MRSLPHSGFSCDMRAISARTSALRRGRPTGGARPPAPVQAPAGAVPPDHGVGRDHDQVPPPVAAQAADEHPEQLVQPAEADARSPAGGPGEHRQLVAQQQVLRDQVTALAAGGPDRREQQDDPLEHVTSMPSSDDGARA